MVFEFFFFRNTKLNACVRTCVRTYVRTCVRMIVLCVRTIRTVCVLCVRTICVMCVRTNTHAYVQCAYAQYARAYACVRTLCVTVLWMTPKYDWEFFLFYSLKFLKDLIICCSIKYLHATVKLILSTYVEIVSGIIAFNTLQIINRNYNRRNTLFRDKVKHQHIFLYDGLFIGFTWSMSQHVY